MTAPELPAEVYLWSAMVESSFVAPPAELADLEPVAHAYAGELRAGAVRMFRDGTRGLLVRLEGEGPLDDLGVELRGFADGPPRAIAGLGARAGGAGGAELLDPLWLGLSPPFDGTARGALRSSWSLGPEGTEPVTWSWAAGCDFGEEARGVRHRICEGSLSMGPERLWTIDAGERERGVWIGEALGTMRAEAVFERGRLVRWLARAEREVVTRWPSGASLRQRQVVQAALQWVGEGTFPAPLPGQDGSEAQSDLAPLRFGDGLVPAPSAPPSETLPFLVLPVDLPPGRRDSLRSWLLGSSTLPPSAPLTTPRSP